MRENDILTLDRTVAGKVLDQVSTPVGDIKLPVGSSVRVDLLDEGDPSVGIFGCTCWLEIGVTVDHVFHGANIFVEIDPADLFPEVEA